jgi:hypothetical protein
MDYLAIYTNIINLAKQRIQPEGYFEKHHIIPKCMGGTNNKDNIIALTAREHYICHKLLCEIYPDNHKLKLAIWIMINGAKSKSHNGNRNYYISSREYDRLKLEYSKAKKELNLPAWNRGKPHSEETKLRIKNAIAGRIRPKQSEVTKKKRSDSLISHYKNLDTHHLKGSIAWNRGKPHSEEALMKIKAASNKKPKEQIICPHCNKLGGKPIMKRFHFDNCKLKLIH